MTAFLFPDSFLGPDAARFVSGLIGTLTLVSPAEVDSPICAKELAAHGLVRQAVPAWQPGEMEAFLAFLTNARTWGAAHQGSDARVAMSRAGNDVEGSLFAIRDHVKPGGKHEQAGQYTLLPSRAFLHLSRRLSSDQHDAEAGLAEVRAKEKAMFQALSGKKPAEKRCLVAPAGRGPEPAAMLRAWAALFLALDEPGRVFVTCGPDCMDLLQEKVLGSHPLFSDVQAPVFPANEKAFDADAEIFRKSLRSVLSGGPDIDVADAAANLAKHPGEMAAELSAIIWPDVSGRELFSRYAGMNEKDAGGRGEKPGALALAIRFIV